MYSIGIAPVLGSRHQYFGGEPFVNTVSHDSNMIDDARPWGSIDHHSNTNTCRFTQKLPRHYCAKDNAFTCRPYPPPSTPLPRLSPCISPDMFTNYDNVCLYVYNLSICLFLRGISERAHDNSYIILNIIISLTIIRTPFFSIETI